MKRLIKIVLMVIIPLTVVIFLFYKTPFGKRLVGGHCDPLSDSCYFKGISSVYYHPQYSFLINVPGYFPLHFISLVNKIDDSDAQTFKRVKEEILFVKNMSHWTSWENSFFSDKKHVYLHGKYIRSADIESFKYIGNGFAVDKNNLYREPDNVLIEDPIIVKTSGGFKPMCFDLYGRDDKNIYYLALTYTNEIRIIEGADSESFNCLQNVYAKDKNYVYYQGKRISSDPLSFQLVGSNEYFAKDKNNVYWNGKIIEGADPNTFHQALDLDEFGGVYADKSYSYDSAGKRTK